MKQDRNFIIFVSGEKTKKGPCIQLFFPSPYIDTYELSIY